ncbi:hypothetical protein EZI54_06865 [Marinobacter halodurans]|uniref:Bacterial type II secretion system protein E domain-containing protein n=1 Tax=Marinobacter halodurans TaxID=2528979 RepID=A0ABY1ZPN1_9GAMM|nr:ATPase, T2SS/T4P/T4SS family [Marinobacter halodurans]TBW57372.1 hypothetical protein EZI54_06865 [Marinobacter halodurans]
MPHSNALVVLLISRSSTTSNIEACAVNVAEPTDWVLIEDEPERSLVYPENVLSDGEKNAKARELLNLCQQKANEGQVDFRIVHNEQPYRGSAQRPLEGRTFFLRALDRRVEPLKPGRIPKPIVQQLMKPSLQTGGLILVSGPPGCGKSTTVARTVAGRLLQFGGVAWCLENPVEFLLQGNHGPGHCWQKEVAQGGYGQAMRDVMRCYPVGVPGILTVGEVRDQETADHCLKAALNGLLVIATVHANTIEMTIERILNMCSEGQRDAFRATLAGSLKLVVHQRRNVSNQVRLNSLWVKHGSSAYGAIRDGRSDLLANDVQYQANRLRMGEPVCE